MRLRIATRGSALALWQADEVARLLQLAWPDLETERLVFKTTGDRFLDRPLSEIGGKGLFTKELEVALADGDADIAVHSLKDMPTALPEGMVIAAVPSRGDVRDCVVTRPGEDPDAAAVIGTSSLRRACLARRRWPEARIEPIRGKVETRARRLHEEGSRRVDAVLLAWAGLVRLGMDARDDLGFRPLAPEGWIPAVGQGALAVECREDDAVTRDWLAAIHDTDTGACVRAERAFLRAVEGDCRVPVGALATGGIRGLRLTAFVGAPDGSARVERVAEGDQPEVLGTEVAREVLAGGGARILGALRG